MRNVVKAFCAVGFGMVTVLSGCASNSTEDDSASTSSGDAITVDDIMARANDYMTHDILYCGGTRGGYDGEHCWYDRADTCDRTPAGAWENYRSDCSGFVSYVWQITDDPTTPTYDSDRGGSVGWTTISIADLREGDALVTDGHIKLYGGASGSDAATIYEQYTCNRVGRKNVQSYAWKTAEHVGFYGDSRSYHAIRRNSLNAPTTPPVKPPPVQPPPVKPPPVQGPPTKAPNGPSACGVIDGSHGLPSGAAVRSCDGRFELVMQDNGDLAEYGPLGAMWSTGTAGSDGQAADMQSDGNFVLYGKTSNALWSSHTQGSGAHLALQDDGNIVVYASNGQGLWGASTTSFPTAPAKPTSCGALEPGQGLAAGDSLASCDGRFELAMQADGNLVAYESGRGLWATSTNGTHAYDVVMQSDGNVVMYSSVGKAVWTSNTQNHPGAILEMQTDGNVVIYDAGVAIWSSHSNQ
jgi:hypothetical protein